MRASTSWRTSTYHRTQGRVSACLRGEDLSGTFFRNGPGKFKAGNDTVVHELDGDGLVLAISFMPEEKQAGNRNGTCRGRNPQVCVRYRLVQTQGLLRDIYAKRLFAKGGSPSCAFLCLPKASMARLPARAVWAWTHGRTCRSTRRTPPWCGAVARGGATGWR